MSWYQFCPAHISARLRNVLQDIGLFLCAITKFLTAWRPHIRLNDGFENNFHSSGSGRKHTCSTSAVIFHETFAIDLSPNFSTYDLLFRIKWLAWFQNVRLYYTLLIICNCFISPSNFFNICLWFQCYWFFLSPNTLIYRSWCQFWERIRLGMFKAEEMTDHFIA